MKKLIIMLVFVLGMNMSFAEEITVTVTLANQTETFDVVADDAMYGVWIDSKFVEAETMDEILYEINYYMHIKYER